jgi:hypothetical protein
MDDLQRQFDAMPGFLPGDIKVEQLSSAETSQRLNDVYADPEVSNIQVSLETGGSSGRGPPGPAEGASSFDCK